MSFLADPIGFLRNKFGNGQPPPMHNNVPMTLDGETQESEPQTPPLSTQLKLSDRELNALATRIQSDNRGAIDDHRVRMDIVAKQEDAWRNKVGIEGGEAGQSNFRVPLVLALCLAKHAREIEAVAGSSASVAATPRGPSDSKLSKRVSLGMSWQVYENMRAFKPIALWMLRRLKHGRSFAKVTWKTWSYNKTTLDPVTKQRIKERIVYKRAPDIEPLDPDHIILPASLDGKTNFNSVQDAAFVHIRCWDTPANMLLMESEPDGPQNPNGDYYQGIRDNWSAIVQFSRTPPTRDVEKDSTTVVKDRYEGVARDGSYTHEQIEIIEAHMKWHRWYEEEQGDEGLSDSNIPFGVSSGSGVDASEVGDLGASAAGQAETLDAGQPQLGGDVEGAEYLQMGMEGKDLAEAGSQLSDNLPDGIFRDTDGQLKYMEESRLILRFIQGLNLIVGVQDADEVYPDSPVKVPVMELALINDGTYWCMSLIELAEEIEKEMTVLINQVIEASDMSIGPPIFYEPAQGETFSQSKYGKYALIPTTNAKGVQQMIINPNVSFFDKLWMLFQTIYEQLTGITNLVMGRALDQPNAPRTLGGQRLVMGAGDVRLALDMRMLNEDLKRFLEWVWDLWRMNGSEAEFERVAEGSSQGEFYYRVPDKSQSGYDHGEMQNGWAQMGAKEREAAYDFTLEFSDDLATREAQKQEWLAIAQAALAYPLVQQNAQIQHAILSALLEAFGENPDDILGPEPPDSFQPLRPDVEWNKMLQGEDVHVHPQDDDAAHIQDHEMRLATMAAGPKDDIDIDGMWKMQQHLQEHQQALAQKQQAARVMQGVAQMIGAANAGMGAAPNDPMSALIQSVSGAQGGQPQQAQQPQPPAGAGQ